MVQKVGAEVEMLAAEDRVYCKVRGQPSDSLSDVANCCHNQWLYLWEREDYAMVDHTEVINVDPTQ